MAKMDWDRVNTENKAKERYSPWYERKDEDQKKTRKRRFPKLVFLPLL